jgi:hypothetical protein
VDRIWSDLTSGTSDEKLECMGYDRYHTIVVQTFRYAMLAIRIFGYNKYSILKYGAILGKGAQHTSWGRSPSDPNPIEYDLNTHMLCALGKKFGAQGSTAPIIAAPSYRLVTVAENIFPAALQDLFSAYHYLILKGFVAKNITITGDSAGRNLGV